VERRRDGFEWTTSRQRGGRNYSGLKGSQFSIDWKALHTAPVVPTLNTSYILRANDNLRLCNRRFLRFLEARLSASFTVRTSSTS
jgi:hypothetical protein